MARKQKTVTATGTPPPEGQRRDTVEDYQPAYQPPAYQPPPQSDRQTSSANLAQAGNNSITVTRRKISHFRPTAKGYGTGVGLLSTALVGLTLEAGGIALAAYLTQGTVFPAAINMLSQSIPLMAGAGAAAALFLAFAIAGAVLLDKNKPAHIKWKRSQRSCLYKRELKKYDVSTYRYNGNLSELPGGLGGVEI